MKFLIVLTCLVAAACAAPKPAPIGGYFGDDHGLSYAVAAPAPVVKYAAAPAPVVSYVHAAPAVHAVHAAPAPTIVKAAVPAATSYATIHQVHTPVHVAAAPAVVKYAAPAPVVQYVQAAPAPVVKVAAAPTYVHAAPAPVVKYGLGGFGGYGGYHGFEGYHGWLKKTEREANANKEQRVATKPTPPAALVGPTRFQKRCWFVPLRWESPGADGIIPFAGTDDERVKFKPAEWNLQNRNLKDIQRFLDHEARTRMANLHKLIEEKYVLHIKNSVDYHRRTTSGSICAKVVPPAGACCRRHKSTPEPVTLRTFLPSSGPPKSAHLLLSCSMDDRIIILKVYYQRHCLRTCSEQWDTRSLGSVNTITFVDDNRRFVITSDRSRLRQRMLVRHSGGHGYADPTMPAGTIPRSEDDPSASPKICKVLQFRCAKVPTFLKHGHQENSALRRSVLHLRLPPAQDDPQSGFVKHRQYQALDAPNQLGSIPRKNRAAFNNGGNSKLDVPESLVSRINFRTRSRFRSTTAPV
ncbi:pre-mRNA splicing factor prp17 [Culex quinquefasciatus]|uniref:Pre-mRNA splicing factor prp17 n=2 Tax=Culex quinquefasciatus TaxID=7176 RepID=B0X6H5_CULQU|nr:pre-mRNA splicing factor prp17 [Culex quinquefasciatus]|eukprot:XP_001865247.1 pre-mRNA splicing factor prp17 [Culex quinquefasciatus]